MALITFTGVVSNDEGALINFTLYKDGVAESLLDDDPNSSFSYPIELAPGRYNVFISVATTGNFIFTIENIAPGNILPPIPPQLDGDNIFKIVV